MKADAVIEIKTELKKLLDNENIVSFSEAAPANHSLPYVTYSFLPSFSDGEYTEVFTIDIDGWDSFSDANGTLRLETIMSTISKALNKKNIKLDHSSFRFLLEGRKELKESDTSIRRRKQVYQVRYLGKE